LIRSSSPGDRSKSRRKFGWQSERTGDNKQSSDYNKNNSKSSFLPIKSPFKQVSRFWGSQRYRQNSTKAPKKNHLPQYYEDELQSDQPVPRRKVRSRSVPNLEALMAMAETNDDIRFLSTRTETHKTKTNDTGQKTYEI